MILIIVGIGIISIIINVVIDSCNEGSCDLFDCFSDCCCIFTCGLCDMRKSESKKMNKHNPNRNKFYQKRKGKHSAKRKNWINKGSEFFN